MNITIKAKSSAGDPYNVEFMLAGLKLTVTCSCKAGKFGQLCKHKTELLAGDRSRLADDTELPLLLELQKIVSSSPELQQIAAAICESEKIIRAEEAKLAKIKRGFAEKLKTGIEVNQ